MGLREVDLRVGKRVMVPKDKVPDRRPWAERYGTIIEIERFMGAAPVISVRLDGLTSHIIWFRLEELDHE